MKILHVHDNFEVKGGSEVYIRDLIQQLSLKAIESDWLAVQETKNKQFKLYLNGTESAIIPYDNFEQSLDEFLGASQYDLVHMHGVSIVNLIEYCLKKYPVVRSLHEPRVVCPGYGKFLTTSLEPCEKKFDLSCLYKAYTQKCQLSRKPLNVLSAYKRVKFELSFATLKYKAIIAMSDYVKNEALKCGISHEKIKLNPYFTKFNLEFDGRIPTQKRVLFVGRLNVTKGVSFVLKAMLPLLKCKEVFLDIVGDGELKKELLTFIKVNKLEAKIFFHGWKSSEEISTLMSKSYLVVFPSIYPEAFGIVGIESFAHSKPVIAFDVGGVSSWLKNNKNGYLVKNKDIDALSLSIKQLLDDDQLYKQFKRNAYNDYKEHFTIDVHLSKLIELYKESIKK